MNTKYSLPTSGEVDRRLRIVSELRNLCLSLGKAGRQAKSSEEAESTDDRLSGNSDNAMPPLLGRRGG